GTPQQPGCLRNRALTVAGDSLRVLFSPVGNNRPNLASYGSLRWNFRQMNGLRGLQLGDVQGAVGPYCVSL
ncbi:hypothetical protein P0D88_53360, partial [Paraburkholderia sp. RL18-103-BIB-C]|uniref:hypothetical protein n=1 Tax=Paraburkholderia sp. RL18-103-BIB-C TaxID=3031637 RepID=UPI0038BD05D9